MKSFEQLNVYLNTNTTYVRTKLNVESPSTSLTVDALKTAQSEIKTNGC